jgi:hypothetical protein
MSETAEVLHHVPERLRLRLDFAKSNSAALHDVRNALAGLAGVRRIDVIPLLGTVVLQYDPPCLLNFPGP